MDGLILRGTQGMANGLRKVEAGNPLPSWLDSMVASITSPREPPPRMIRLPYTSEPIYVAATQKEAAKLRRQGYQRVWTEAKARQWFDVG